MIQPPAHMPLPAWSEIGMGLANHLWQSTVFMIAVGALTLLFSKNSAFIRYRLWLIASVKFLIPLSLLIGIGTVIGERVEWPAPPQIEQSQISFVFRQIGQPFVAAPAMPPTFRAGPPLTAGTSPLAAILTALWFIGAAAVLVTWCVKWIQTARLVGKAEPFESSQTIARIRIRTSTSRMEPGVFGIFRPVLLLPEGVARNLPAEQLEPIIAHEMIHVSGRDNLAAALHTIVEAMFWFHPLVWWLGNKLVEERERACDEAVLQMGFEPADYAEGILKFCKSNVMAPACMAGISGSNLKKRIEAIMENRGTHSLTPGKKLLLTIVGVAVLIVPVFAGMISAEESPIGAVPEVQQPVLSQPVLSQAEISQPVLSQPALSQPQAPPSRQNPSVRAVQAEPQTGAVRITVVPVIEGATVTFLPVLSQAVVPSPQQPPTPPVVPAVSGPDKWLDDVSIIATDEERKAFQRLTKEQERENFITNFWLVRDPTPGTAANEFRGEYNSRYVYANQYFTTRSGIPGPQTDRGKMYILNGPPDEIVSHPSGGTYYRPANQGGNTAYTFPFETWRYRHLDGKGDNLIYEFVDRQKSGEYTLEYDPTANRK